MLFRTSLVATAFACLLNVGCGSMRCGNSCGPGASMAFAKFDCSYQDACGPGGCGNAPCGCGGSCGDTCTGGEAGGWCRQLLDSMCGCSGCSQEAYWNEWHNDPPAVYEPCDCLGNYTGPGGAGYYRAPYRHVAPGP